MVTNKQIKLIQSLQQKKFRKKEQLFVVEGKKMVEEAVQSNFEVVNVYATAAETFSFSHKVELVDQATMKKMSALKTPSTALALVRLPNMNETEITTNWSLGLEAVRDPGNLGTIIRTADWFGIETIYCSLDCVDIFNDKTVQASMGSIFRVKIVYTDLIPLVDAFSERQIPIYATLLEGQNIYNIEDTKAGLILMGNEGKGLTDTLKTKATVPVHIPGKGKAESLNVAMATGIVMALFCK